ncbi:MAG: hypothetical protein AM1032_000402 [Mycoplasmataceae bacterium]|nr:MAG: hypothetical protein AM1032_000402 [Mycoplasmataceae bacterium]
MNINEKENLNLKKNKIIVFNGFKLKIPFNGDELNQFSQEYNLNNEEESFIEEFNNKYSEHVQDQSDEEKSLILKNFQKIFQKVIIKELKIDKSNSKDIILDLKERSKALVESYKNDPSEENLEKLEEINSEIQIYLRALGFNEENKEEFDEILENEFNLDSSQQHLISDNNISEKKNENETYEDKIFRLLKRGYIKEIPNLKWSKKYREIQNLESNWNLNKDFEDNETESEYLFRKLSHDEKIAKLWEEINYENNTSWWKRIWEKIKFW